MRPVTTIQAHIDLYRLYSDEASRNKPHDVTYTNITQFVFGSVLRWKISIELLLPTYTLTTATLSRSDANKVTGTFSTLSLIRHLLANSTAIADQRGIITAPIIGSKRQLMDMHQVRLYS